MDESLIIDAGYVPKSHLSHRVFVKHAKVFKKSLTDSKTLCISSWLEYLKVLLLKGET